MAWVLIPAGKSLFAEFNELAPNRDHASDGAVGDLAHQSSTSDHNPDETGNTGSSSDSDSVNEVHAIDVDKDLNQAGTSMEECVQTILGRCRSGLEKRLKYVIFNSRIWTATGGWTKSAYSGANPHDHHAHFSFRYGSGSGASNPENDTSPWGLLDEEGDTDMPLATDMISLTRDTAKAIGKEEGDKVSAATLLQLAVIHAQRSGAYTVAGNEAVAKAVADAAGDRDAAMAALSAAVAKAAEERARASDELADILATLEAAGGSPELAPVMDQLNALQARLASAGEALTGDGAEGAAAPA